LNVLGCNGIVAAGLPIGTGAALATRLAKTDSVVIAFFGDGGANQGVVHEALNLAAVWKLPIVYLCENNQYALSTATARTTAGEEAVELGLDRAVEFAKASPEPTVELMESSVYAPHLEVGEPARGGGREITMAEALNEALHGEMERDKRVFVMGEDVGLIGGI